MATRSGPEVAGLLTPHIFLCERLVSYCHQNKQPKYWRGARLCCIAPHTAHFLRQLFRVAAKLPPSTPRATAPSTAVSLRVSRSTTASASHTTSIVRDELMTDALNICGGITKLKKRLLMQSRAA